MDCQPSYHGIVVDAVSDQGLSAVLVRKVCYRVLFSSGINAIKALYQVAGASTGSSRFISMRCFQIKRKFPLYDYDTVLLSFWTIRVARELSFQGPLSFSTSFLQSFGTRRKMLSAGEVTNLASGQYPFIVKPIIN